MGEDTPFPERDTIEWPYDLSTEYASFFNDIVEFARKLVVPDASGKKKKRVQYWTALGLLRGVMSSPGAGVKMLATRLDKLAAALGDDTTASKDAAEADADVDAENPIGDIDFGVDGDTAPTQVMEQGGSYQQITVQLRVQLGGGLDYLSDVKSMF